MKTYLFQYHHDGATWMFEMPADSREDAEARIKKLPNAAFVGTLGFRVPAQLGWFARLWCWFSNR